LELLWRHRKNIDFLKVCFKSTVMVVEQDDYDNDDPKRQLAGSGWDGLMVEMMLGTRSTRSTSVKRRLGMDPLQ
jgi:hypothetical protein